ncbi:MULTISPECIES: hypothetical protein [unclassified Amycolatopsis]|uniref:hypothetical protein n=1 Tax=unclassified Amycolatopsis TaxID=2618356 RepID=UPI003418CA2C
MTERIGRVTIRVNPDERGRRQVTDDHLAHVVGSHVRFFRSTKPLTKTAGLAGITPDSLHQIEPR